MEEFIHIGCPKTASTTLQNNLFARHPEIASIGKPYDSRESELATQIYQLITKDDQTFDFDRCQRALEEEKERKTSHGGIKATMLSEEKIYVSPAFERTAVRLKKLFPSAKIVITIRNQLDLIVSWYCQGCYDGRYWRWAGIPNDYGDSYVSLDQFLDFTFSSHDPNVSEVFHFYNKAMVFSEVFGRENVFVFPIEKLKLEPALFVEELSEGLGIDSELAFELTKGKAENKRNTGNLSFYRFNSKIAPLRKVPIMGSILNHAQFEQISRRLIYKFAQHEISLSDHWRKKLTELYSKENRRVSAEFDLELSEFGYPI